MLAIIENICDVRITFLYLYIWHIHLKKEMWNDWECFTIILGTHLTNQRQNKFCNQLTNGLTFTPSHKDNGLTATSEFEIMKNSEVIVR